jgi:hypothetical protein
LLVAAIIGEQLIPVPCRNQLPDQSEHQLKGRRMSGGDFVWGAVLVAGGVFVGVYGELLFRFVLAVIGFMVGFTALYILLDNQSQAERILISVIAGGVGALLLYTLFNFGIYVAGAALGAVAGLVIAGLIGVASSSNDWLAVVLVLVGAGGAGFFGPRLGAMIIPLGTAAVAALMLVYGYLVWFQSTYTADASEPQNVYTSKSLLTLFAMFYVLSFLAQWNIAKLRQRLRN